jgi:YbbR domain-containing protein
MARFADLALLITGVLWLSVASQPVTTLNNVPIVLDLRDNPDLVVSKSEPVNARLALRGPRDVLDRLSPNDLAVVADLSRVEEGVNMVPLQVDRGKLPASVQERGVEPKNVRVIVERMSQKEVQIQPRFAGDIPPGYQLTWDVTPRTIWIRGLAKQMDSVSHVSTETISLSGRVGEFTEHVALDVILPNIVIAEGYPERVHVRYAVQEPPADRVITRVPVMLMDAPGGTVSPRLVSVRISGPKSIVQTMTADDLIVSARPEHGAGSPHDVLPTVVFKKEADRVTVKSVQPGRVRVSLK